MSVACFTSVYLPCCVAAAIPRIGGMRAGLQGPAFHVHVDGRGLCDAAAGQGDRACRGLVNLILLHERHEHVIRRLFPVTDISTTQPPLWAVAPKLMEKLGRLTVSKRTERQVRALFRENSAELQAALMELVFPGVNASNKWGAAGMPPFLLFRWWSLNVAAVARLSRYSQAKNTVEYRAGSMAPSYAMALKVSLYRRLVHTAVRMVDDLDWASPLPMERARLLVVPRANLSAYHGVVSAVTRAQMVGLLDSIKVNSRERRRFMENFEAQAEHAGAPSRFGRERSARVRPRFSAPPIPGQNSSSPCRPGVQILQTRARAATVRSRLAHHQSRDKGTSSSSDCVLLPRRMPRTAYVLAAGGHIPRSWRGMTQVKHGPISAADILRLHLRALAELPSSLAAALVMYPECTPALDAIPGYLDVGDAAHQLPFYSELHRLPNNSLGSYGMYLQAFAATREQHDYYIFAEDDYVPARPHFDALLVRLYESVFRKGRHARGVLAGVLQGRPIEAESPFELHLE